MGSLDIFKVFLEPLREMGLAGFVIVLLASMNVAQWRASQSRQKREDELVDKMFELSKETNVTIERITGRY